MGIKANATAVINLTAPKAGWWVKPNNGMACMFTMMNAARLGQACKVWASAKPHSRTP